jgi:hypothetical protein
MERDIVNTVFCKAIEKYPFFSVTVELACDEIDVRVLKDRDLGLLYSHESLQKIAQGYAVS